jgi:hypothetical protein
LLRRYERCSLMSDAIAAAGLGDGSYRFGALEVEVRAGVLADVLVVDEQLELQRVIASGVEVERNAERR